MQLTGAPQAITIADALTSDATFHEPRRIELTFTLEELVSMPREVYAAWQARIAEAIRRMPPSWTVVQWQDPATHTLHTVFMPERSQEEAPHAAATIP